VSDSVEQEANEGLLKGVDHLEVKEECEQMTEAEWKNIVVKSYKTKSVIPLLAR
jgi:hypothetical protein